MTLDQRPYAGVTPRRRARALLRGQTKGVPLFLPLAVGLGARVEGWEVKDFLENPTYLSRGIESLHKAAGLEGVFVAGPSGAEAEGLGASLDWSVYPPRVASACWKSRVTGGGMPKDDMVASIVSHPRVQASLEATRRLIATVRGEPLIAAAIIGPWALAGQLAGVEWEEAEDSSSLLEFCGKIGAELARQYCEAGSDLVVVFDEVEPPPDHALLPCWEAALVPVSNIMRFHKKLLLMVVGGKARSEGFSSAVVPRFVDQWSAGDTMVDVVVTDGELPLTTDLTQVRERINAFRRALI